MAVIRKIHSSSSAVNEYAEYVAAADGKDLNGAVALTAHHLRDDARPEATAAIVILTDNGGSRGISDRAARDALWQTNVILSGLLVKTADRPQEADVRQFIDATGGEMLPMDEENVPLAEILRSLRARYAIAWRAPGGTPKTIRPISVDLTAEARARLGDASVRAPGAYVVAESSAVH